METIYKVLVGSRAHNLATENSDYDYRGVFVVPTNEILSLFSKTKQTDWKEDEIDDTNYEVQKFLEMACKSNPSVIEMFRSPVQENTIFGEQLRQLFSAVWSKKYLHDASVGYSINQEKKLMQNYQGRWCKYAVAYIRVLEIARQIFDSGDFEVEVKGELNQNLREIKEGKWSVGQIVDYRRKIMEDMEKAYEKCPEKECDTKQVNDFLLSLRQFYFYKK